MMPAVARLARAAAARSAHRSMLQTYRARRASSAVWYPYPVPTSRKVSRPVSARALSIAAKRGLGRDLLITDCHRSVELSGGCVLRRHEQRAGHTTHGPQHRTSTVIKIDDRIGVDWERWSARSAPSSC